VKFLDLQFFITLQSAASEIPAILQA